MLCSNCGFENPTGHHFCGMCGTPLPQRPIIATGAQSTADLTRHPLEISPPAASSATNFPSLSSPSATDAVEPESVATGPNYFSQAEEAESLEQFIAGFQYKPPAEEEEVTMTGAKAELDDARYEPAAPISMSDEPSEPAAEVSPDTDGPHSGNAEPVQPEAIEAASSPIAEDIADQPPLIVTEPPPFATKGAKIEEPERSRFLEFSGPANEAVPTTEAEPAPVPTGIVGPSFLGLSDTPASTAYIADDVTEPRSHWHVWVAAMVVAIFAVLGTLEWRAMKNEGSNGPIGVMKMQLDRLTGKRGAVTTPPAASQSATESTPDAQPNGSGPAMQVAPQPKMPAADPQTAPNKETPPAKQPNPGAASGSPPTGTPAAKAQQPPTQPASKPQTQQTKSDSTKAEAATTPDKSASQSAESEEPAKPTTPGADELAKAANASDAAAASAWLWKSVAKGNPEAPIKLANLYIKGEGVPQSCEQALVLLRSAAAKENAPARSRLGTLYATGTCVPRNRVRAYQYMSEALDANPNAAWARDFRQQLWAQMTPDERQRAQKAQ